MRGYALLPLPLGEERGEGSGGAGRPRTLDSRFRENNEPGCLPSNGRHRAGR